MQVTHDKHGITLDLHIVMHMDDDQYDLFCRDIWLYIASEDILVTQLVYDLIADDHYMLHMAQEHGTYEVDDLAAFAKMLSPRFFLKDLETFPVLKAILQINWLNWHLREASLDLVDHWTQIEYEAHILTLPTTIRVAGFEGDLGKFKALAFDLFEKMILQPPTDSQIEAIDAAFVHQKLLT